MHMKGALLSLIKEKVQASTFHDLAFFHDGKFQEEFEDLWLKTYTGVTSPDYGSRPYLVKLHHPDGTFLTTILLSRLDGLPVNPATLH
jgi:hypothetical protein